MRLGRPAVLLACLVGLGLFVGFGLLAGGEARQKLFGPRSTERAAGRDGQGPLEPVRAPLEREADGATTSDPAADPDRREPLASDAAERPWVERTGRVLAMGGEPVAEAEIVTVGGERRLACSDARGFFRLVPDESGGATLRGGERLEVSTGGYVTVASAVVDRDPRVPMVLVVARSASFSGKVVDEEGEPIAGARVLVDPHHARLRWLIPAGSRVEWRRFHTRSHADGSFHLDRVPTGIGPSLLVTAAGHLAHREEGDLQYFQGAADRVVTLAKLGARTFGGRVVHADGEPAEGALVRFRLSETVAGRRGKFRLPQPGSKSRAREDEERFHGRPGDALVATLEGYAPAVAEAFGQRLLSGSPEPVLLVLGEASSRIAGRVLLGDGRPASRWRIKLLDGELVSYGRRYPLTAEDLAAGAHAELIVSEDGRFEIGGLTVGRTYRLRAWDLVTLLSLTSEAIPAGTEDVLLRASSEPFRPLVDGIVVGRDGIPLDGIRVRLTMVEHRVAGGTWSHTGQKAVTGPGGTFRFEHVPHGEDLYLRFDGEGTTRASVELGPEVVGRDLRVVLDRRGRFELALGDAREGDRVVVIDEQGERLRLKVHTRPGTTEGMEAAPLEGGRTDPISVTDDARWILQLRDGQEVRRLPLLLRPGETVRVGEWSE